MQTVYIMRGLPASGKSTIAKDMLKKAQGKMKRINKDLLREMIDAGSWSREKEKFIIRMRDNSIENYLMAGYDVIVDDTNLANKHIVRIQQIVDIYNKDKGFIKKNDGAHVEIIDLTHVSYYECIKRDATRANPVGIEVISKMYFQFIFDKEAWIKPFNTDLASIIVDLDGTLAIHQGRSPYDVSKYGEDGFNYNLWFLIKDKDKNIIFLSGREGTEEAKEITLDWLRRNTGLNYGFLKKKLFMREKGDSRPDSIVKSEIYENEIKPNFNIVAVYDDRDQVVDMWRSKGIFCCQVNYGGF